MLLGRFFDDDTTAMISLLLPRQNPGAMRRACATCGQCM